MAKKDAKLNNKDNSKESKNKKSFFKGLKAELKKVIWPTPKQLFNNTVAVITIVLITTLIVLVLDVAFRSLDEYGIDKIKESIQTLNSTSSDENSTSEDNKTTETNETVENEENSNQTEESSENAVTTENTINESQDNTTTNSVE